MVAFKFTHHTRLASTKVITHHHVLVYISDVVFYISHIMCETKMLIYVILMCELICPFPRVHNIFEKQGRNSNC